MPLLNLNKPTTIAVGAVVALFVLAMALHRCHAAPTDAPYVQVSGGETVIRGPTQVLDLTLTEPAPQLGGAYLQQSLTVIGTSTFKGQAVPNNFAARALFVDGFGHFDIGVGLSWMQNPSPYNGGPVNFALQLAYRFPHVTATYAHMSNAGSRLPNYGRDILMLGWRFH